jgi:hypothetical protein
MPLQRWRMSNPHPHPLSDHGLIIGCIIAAGAN